MLVTRGFNNNRFVLRGLGVYLSFKKSLEENLGIGENVLKSKSDDGEEEITRYLLPVWDFIDKKQTQYDEKSKASTDWDKESKVSSTWQRTEKIQKT